MVTNRAEDLKAVMHDNATFIHFPPIGSSTSMITVYGDHRVNIQRTIRSVMQLVGNIFPSIRIVCATPLSSLSPAFPPIIGLIPHDSRFSHPTTTFRHVNSTSPHFGYFQRNSMSCCRPQASTPRKSRTSSSKFLLRQARRSSSRACVSRCTALRTKSATQST